MLLTGDDSRKEAVEDILQGSNRMDSTSRSIKRFPSRQPTAKFRAARIDTAGVRFPKRTVR